MDPGVPVRGCRVQEEVGESPPTGQRWIRARCSHEKDGGYYAHDYCSCACCRKTESEFLKEKGARTNHLAATFDEAIGVGVLDA
jgi:hypothetical protein